MTYYYWRGVRVPGDWIEHPDRIDPVTALMWPNVEQRRAACEIMGWRRVLDALPHRVVDEDPEPEIGTLLEVDLPDAPNEKFLRVRCGTGRDFVLPVPPDCKTALDAQAWMYPGISAKEIRGREART